MSSKIKKNSKGFTIVELLIVIIIIGILAALVLNSFRGVQERARDTERQTDVKAQASQLEVYYSDKGGYPTFLTEIDTNSWIKDNFKGADVAAWQTPGNNDPNATTNSMANTATPTKDQYGYQPLQDDGTTACTTEPCAKFKLFWKAEKDGVVHETDSLN